MGPDVPLEHLFTTSGGLKRSQMRPKISPNWDLHQLGCFFGWIWVFVWLHSIHPLWALGYGSSGTLKTPFYHLWKPQEGTEQVWIHPNWNLHLLGCFFGWFWVFVWLHSLYPLWTLGYGSICTLKTPFYHLWKPKKGTEQAGISSKWYLHLVGCFFGWIWVFVWLHSLYPWWILGFGYRCTPKTSFYHLWRPQEGLI